MRDKTELRRKDFYTALVLIGLSLFFLYKTSEIPFFEANAAGVESGKWYNSAALVPYAVFVAMLVLSVTLLVIAIKGGGKPTHLSFEQFSGWFVQGGGKVTLIAVYLLLYIFALVPRIDFTIASALVFAALVFSFHEDRFRPMLLGLFFVAVPSFYALVVHLPRAEWTKPHDDDWVGLISFILLCISVMTEIRLTHGRFPFYAKLTPFIAAFLPLLLVVTMAFGFRQNVPNRTGLIFQNVEYHYYVTIKPWLAGKS
ncbi:MAG: hypothetical protein ABJN26_26785 [Stappiaceae bacterium]